ncbi:MFS transporter [Bifidobacterium oedipodis]|uniref:MFS transporter n=1 Tax=Bifidobacterium oedipodis TaxID=2675322 RepID=A0A7Y0HRZ2_9BIFI|nr:MFS transporter [Bifidobacterium sp. DSM 109957]NMM93018.1 MFS transporter [Bifidobacterium sp. DSM 109957]
MTIKPQSFITKLAVLSISLILTSAVAISSALPQMREELGISMTQSEMLSTVPNVAVAIFVILSSWIAQKFGVKRVITIGVLLIGIGGIVPMFVSSYPVILASRLLMGVGSGLYNALAVSIINALYTGDTKANLLGWRSSAENIGQAAFMAIAGLLLTFGWHWSFAIYLAAFPIAAFFWFIVPDITIASDTPTDEHGKKLGYGSIIKETNPFVYALALFAVLLVLNSIAIQVRFPSICNEVMGEGFNSGLVLSLMPLVGIVAGAVFGTVHKLTGKGTLYLGLIAYIAANLLIGLSNGNFAMVLAGMLVSGIPCSWCFPYIFNGMDSLTSARTIAFATSTIFIGTNTGTFIAPLAMQAIQSVLHTDSLYAPFPVLGGIFILILIGLAAHDLIKRRSA